jgi:uncharacterized membrane protein
MQWIIENWLLLLVGGGMLAMHLFGHGHGHKRERKGDGDTAHQKSSGDTEHPAQATADRSREDNNA